MKVINSIVPNTIQVDGDILLWDLINTILDSEQDMAPVVKDGKLEGLVSIHDILGKVVPNYVRMDEKLMDVMHEGYFEERFRKIAHLTARDLMVRNPDLVRPDDAVIRAVAKFVSHNRKTLPVVEHDGRFVGLITRKSVLRRLDAKVKDLIGGEL